MKTASSLRSSKALDINAVNLLYDTNLTIPRPGKQTSAARYWTADRSLSSTVLNDITRLFQLPDFITFVSQFLMTSIEFAVVCLCGEG